MPRTGTKEPLYESFGQPEHSTPPCFSPSSLPLFFLFLELILHFCQNLSRFGGTPSIQVFTKVSNFVLSSLIARLALAMLYKYSDLWVLVWEYLYVVVHLIYMQFELKLTSYFACVGVVYLVPSRPRPNHRRSPAPSRRRHHTLVSLLFVLILFIKKNLICMI